MDASSLDLSSLSPSQKDEMMQTVQKQIAVANTQELIQRLSDKCIKKCIPKPGTSLDNTEKVLYTVQQCITRCMDRFVDAWNVVSKSYQQRLQQESMGMTSGMH